MADTIDIGWRYDAGGPIMATPTVDNGTLYVGYNPGLLALDPDSGTLQREFVVNGDVRTQPQIAESLLMVGSNRGMDEGYLQAFDPHHGDEVWSKEYGSDISVLDGNDELVTLACGERIFAYSPVEGIKRWEFDKRTPGDRHAYVSDILLDNDSVYVSCENDLVYCVDASTGVTSWEFETIGNPGPLLSDGDTLYVGPKGVLNRMTEGIFYGLDSTTGDVRWQVSVEYGINDPAVDSDAIYFPENERIRALRRDSGESLWSTNIGDSISNIVRYGDLVLTSTQNGEIIALERFHGDIRIQKKIADEWFYSLTTEGSMVYAATESGTILSLELPTDTETASSSHTHSSESQVADESPAQTRVGTDPTCSHCGTKLVCTHCGSALTPQFCPSCGAELVDICPSCSRELEGGESFCPDCGIEL